MLSEIKQNAQFLIRTCPYRHAWVELLQHYFSYGVVLQRRGETCGPCCTGHLKQKAVINLRLFRRYQQFSR